MSSLHFVRFKKLDDHIFERPKKMKLKRWAQSVSGSMTFRSDSCYVCCVRHGLSVDKEYRGHMSNKLTDDLRINRCYKM